MQLSYEGSTPFDHLMSTVNCIICGLPSSLFGLVLWGPTAKFLSIMQLILGSTSLVLYTLVPQVITLELSRKTKTGSVMTLQC